MRLIGFNLKVKTKKSAQTLLSTLNEILGTTFENIPYEQGGDFTIWKNEIFGLEVSLYYFPESDEFFFEGSRNERIASLIPSDAELSCTDISTELLDLLKLTMPNESWSK